jgi:hypothetical protein
VEIPGCWKCQKWGMSAKERHRQGVETVQERSQVGSIQQQGWPSPLELKSWPDVIVPDMKLQDLMCFDLLGFSVPLVLPFLSLLLFLPFRIGIFTLCHCVLGICNFLLYFIGLTAKRVPWLWMGTLNLDFWTTLEHFRLWEFIQLDWIHFVLWGEHEPLGTRGEMLQSE